MNQTRYAAIVTFVATAILPLQTFAQTSVACDSPALISAITTAVNSGTPQTLSLAAGCTYTLTSENSGDSAGFNGLPLITGAQITILGNGATIERASTASTPFRIFQVTNTGTLDISDVTLRGGLTRTSTIRSQGDGEDGGAILNSGRTTVTDATITDNRCGDGIAVSDLETATDGGSGGGLANSGTMIVQRSTIVNNRTGNGGIQNGAPGVGGGISNSGTLTVVNSTICNNSVGTGFPSASGGAIYSSFNGTVTVKNSTICGNSDPSGGAVVVESATVTLVNTILSGNTPKNCSRTVNDGGHNLELGDTCGFSATKNSLINTDPLLANLADNGGKTQTAAISGSSPAVGGGDSAVCSDTDVGGIDQRSLPRPTTCDIGAFEAGAEANCNKKPAKPTLLSPDQNFSTSESKVTLTWSSVPCAVSYLVEIVSGKTVIQSKKVKSATSLLTKALKPKSYSWSVQACNKKGCARSVKRKFIITKAARSSN